MTAQPCRRCKAPDAPHTLRNQPTCRGCVVDYVESKVVKRFGVLAKETRTSPAPVARRYLAGLSFGPSSSLLTQLLDKTAEYHTSRKASSPFEPLVVHVDTCRHEGQSPAEPLLDEYRHRFPHVSFQCVPLTSVLAVKTLDWSVLPSLPATGGDAERLHRFLDDLPSASSRADILRLFIRHLLLHTALEKGYSALLLAHSATALASLTLAEVANGRGFAVPWEINDGPFPACTYGPDSDSSTNFPPIYYPVREVLKSEVATYIDIVPSLTNLVPHEPPSSSAVVSHKDMSIEEVMTRYFDGVEGPHAGVIANVVRITAKLDRSAGTEFCRLCSLPLDDEGNSRWAGELGDISEDFENSAGQIPSSKLCYGCQRSLKG